MPNEVWDEITYLILHFNDVEVWEGMNNFVSRFMIDAIDYWRRD